MLPLVWTCELIELWPAWRWMQLLLNILDDMQHLFLLFTVKHFCWVLVCQWVFLQHPVCVKTEVLCVWHTVGWALQGTARLLCNSFSSSLWMLPFSKHCHVNDRMCSKRQCADGKVGPHFFCDKNEAEGNSSSWPVDIAKVEFPASPGEIQLLWLWPAFVCCLL
jgi:hypothetical protein